MDFHQIWYVHLYCRGLLWDCSLANFVNFWQSYLPRLIMAGYYRFTFYFIWYIIICWPTDWFHVRCKIKFNSCMCRYDFLSGEELHYRVIYAGLWGKLINRHIYRSETKLNGTTTSENVTLDMCARVDSNQPVHSRNLIRIFTCSIFDIQGYLRSSGQRRLRSNCADAQADLSLRWAHMSEGAFPPTAAQLYNVWNGLFFI